MTTLTSAPPSLAELAATPVAVAAPRRGLLSLYLELTKAQLSALVLVTTAVGFILGTRGEFDWLRLLWTILGTALAAGCASAFNQLWEIRRDARMHRTENRPLPSGSMSPVHALVAATLMGYGGLCMLALGVNLQASGLALLTIILYVLAYTPLKSRSTLNTLVGAVCGAIPPMIGWVAAAGRLEFGAWILGAILFVWQIPHFFALAWLYRADYERGGFAMLPVLDRDGRITTQVILITSLMLIPLGLLATLLNVAGIAAAIGSLALGLWLLALSIRLHRTHRDDHARALFVASIAYLPLLLALLVIDRGPLG